MTDVLLIEDDEKLRELLVVAFESAGLTVSAARDGSSGVSMFRADPARAVVADLYLPKMDGFEVLSVLRRESESVRIILMSGGSRAGNISPLAAAKALGADKVLIKPFAPHELIEAVREALGLDD